ncbi:alpha-L-arabinofuranosidase, partial [Catellatospora aurea]
MTGISTIPPAVSRRQAWRVALTTVVVTALVSAGMIVMASNRAQAATVDTSAWYILVNRNS